MQEDDITLILFWEIEYLAACQQLKGVEHRLEFSRAEYILELERLVMNRLPVTVTTKTSHSAIKSEGKGKGKARETEPEDDNGCITGLDELE